MEFTQVAADTFQKLQMNAGVMLSEFNPATGTLNQSAIMGATTGGFTFNSNPAYEDIGADVDNCPANTKQLKRLTGYDPTASGTFLSINTARTKQLVGAADIDSANAARIVPSNQLKDADFTDIWIVGDYSDKNKTDSTAGSAAGFVAVHIKNALNTSGFQWTTTKDGKGQFAFEFHGHYDLNNIDDVPFEIYVKAGTDAETTGG